MRSYLLFLSIYSVYVAVVLARPQSHRIVVPYHRQQTDFGCGDASLQMILDYYGVQANQFSLMDVMRSTAHEGKKIKNILNNALAIWFKHLTKLNILGTLSLEIIRGAHFSALSSSMGRIYPDFKVIFEPPDPEACNHDDSGILIIKHYSTMMFLWLPLQNLAFKRRI